MTARKPDTRIVRRGRNHSYLLDGEKVPGVTTILNGGFPKQALVGWAAKACANEVRGRWRELADLDPDERFELVRTAPDRDRDEAARRGTEAHDYAVRYLAGETITPPEVIAGHVDGYIRFVEEWRPEELLVEGAVFHRVDVDAGVELAYGGRLDLIARLADGLVWLLDLKTTRSGVFLENVLQLAGYRYAEFYVLPDEVDDQGAAIEHPMPRIDRTGVVWLRADGTYELYPVDAGPDAFALFGLVQRIAEFAGSNHDDWIDSPLRPPVHAEEAA